MRICAWHLAIVPFLMATGVSADELHVKDFGAIGDGVHDDGPALLQVLAAASRADKSCAIVFETEKTYYVAPHGKTNGRLMLYGQRMSRLTDETPCWSSIHPIVPWLSIGPAMSCSVTCGSISVPCRTCKGPSPRSITSEAPSSLNPIRVTCTPSRAITVTVHFPDILQDGSMGTHDSVYFGMDDGPLDRAQLRSAASWAWAMAAHNSKMSLSDSDNSYACCPIDDWCPQTRAAHAFDTENLGVSYKG